MLDEPQGAVRLAGQLRGRGLPAPPSAVPRSRSRQHARKMCDYFAASVLQKVECANALRVHMSDVTVSIARRSRAARVASLHFVARVLCVVRRSATASFSTRRRHVHASQFSNTCKMQVASRLGASARHAHTLKASNHLSLRESRPCCFAPEAAASGAATGAAAVSGRAFSRRWSSRCALRRPRRMPLA